MEKEGLLVEENVYNSQFILEANSDEEESVKEKSKESVVFSDHYYKSQNKSQNSTSNYDIQLSKSARNSHRK